MKHTGKNLILALCITTGMMTGCLSEKVPDFPEDLKMQVTFKTPGNPSGTYSLSPESRLNGYVMTAGEPIPVDIEVMTDGKAGSLKRITVSVTAREEVNLNLAGQLLIGETRYEDVYFLLPGFWYRQNLRSPDQTPSARVSHQWMVREDRLSIPLSGMYNKITGESVTLCRVDDISADALMPYGKGEVILHGATDVGSLGFGDGAGHVSLSFGYPFSEYPYTYIRKLTLDPPVTAFQKLKKGETRTSTWEIRRWQSGSYSNFVEEVWNHAYDLFQPEELPGELTDHEIKTHLTDFFTQSYTDDYELKGFSGVHLRTDLCEKRGILEIGFIGRVLLNAYNALEYGYDQEAEQMLRMAHAVFDSYESDGFTRNGFIREVVDFPNQQEPRIYSIRRQSEGLYAILLYLSLEDDHHRMHPGMNSRARTLLDNVVALQSGNEFPRKFTDEMEVVDSAGGSTSTAVVPLLMGWKYFNDERYLEAARKAAGYLEEEIISRGDYFSSTLDANCEDKEASIYAASAMFYLGLTADGELQDHYYSLSEKAAYFTLSWYYLWDVPFAPGQMLGDLGFRTRGWGNVSVENNHVDVYIFDFADVLVHLSDIHGNERLAEMAAVIRSSMREQLLPVEGRMCGIGKTGYYPEVVQHTNWDYGQFGKGYYNDIFAPGWTVASLWELLSDNRLYDYFLSE